MSIPDYLPTLAAGPHPEGSGQACVMEYVSMLAGEQFSDTPKCTHYVLAKTAQCVNDMVDDVNRHLLVPLIGRLFGSQETKTTDGKNVSVELANWSAEHAQKSAASAASAAAASAAANYAAATTTYADYASAANYAASAAYAAAAAAATNYAAAAHTEQDQARVKFLTELIDEYDRLTGRVETRDVTAEDLMNLVCELKVRV